LTVSPVVQKSMQTVWLDCKYIEKLMLYRSCSYLDVTLVKF